MTHTGHCRCWCCHQRLAGISAKTVKPIVAFRVAVCLLPGTELAFEGEIESQAVFRLFSPRKLGANVARFRRVNENQRYMHHDALELPGGQVVLLTMLREGQRATVIQLPATERQHKARGETIWDPSPSIA